MTLKTIYDPSMSGFALSRTAAFTGFTSSGDYVNNSINDLNVSGSFTKGWNFYTTGWKTGNTIFFHALGFRDTNSARSSGIGHLINVLVDGNYWTSGASTASYGRYLSFSSAFVCPLDCYFRSYGNIIRPAKE